ncbi:MAG: Hsp20/alpha crystallin family protein [Proteobacteria bacterium]|nr:Hsp20/alpha crystallin family protein [Pseudomonadota bacterium]
MTLVRWNPLREVPVLQNRINRLFDDFFPERSLGEFMGQSGTWNPVVDIFDTENATVIKADLPGLKKEDITINVEGNTLSLSGERSQDEEVKKEKVYRRERIYGMFKREFTMPSTVDHEKIKAEFKDGVLRIEIPKPEEKKPKSIAVH